MRTAACRLAWHMASMLQAGARAHFCCHFPVLRVVLHVALCQVEQDGWVLLQARAGWHTLGPALGLPTAPLQATPPLCTPARTWRRAPVRPTVVPAVKAAGAGGQPPTCNSSTGSSEGKLLCRNDSDRTRLLASHSSGTTSMMASTSLALASSCLTCGGRGGHGGGWGGWGGCG